MYYVYGLGRDLIKCATYQVSELLSFGQLGIRVLREVIQGGDRVLRGLNC